MPVRAIPALYMRGGTSKGVFFRAGDLPSDPSALDAMLLRVIGSPDPYGSHIDGMGGATSSTSKVVLLQRSARPGFDVDYRFAALSPDSSVVDWSGSCGNLAAAVGPVALHWGLCEGPADGQATVRIWQVNLGEAIVARVPMSAGRVLEEGDFVLDGVAFPSAEIQLEFLEPGGGGSGLFPSGRVVDVLEVPGLGPIEATLIDAGNPAVFVDAQALQLRGTEQPAAVNADAALLARCEAVRAQATVAMGLARDAAEASASRPATPKLCFVSAPQDYVASDGRRVADDGIDLTARILSMGRLHHAMTGTGAVALAAAAVVQGTVVSRVLRDGAGPMLRVGHPAGMLSCGAQARRAADGWHIDKVLLSRSARRLMEGNVFVAMPEQRR